MNIGAELWSQIREDLCTGRTYEALVDGFRYAPNISLESFDTVITLFADAPGKRGRQRISVGV